MILRQVLVLAALGLAIGLPAALGASKLLQSFLFGIKANDPPALASAIASQWLLKSAYEAIATPLTYLVVNRLKRAEGLDPFDRSTDFNPLHVA